MTLTVKVKRLLGIYQNLELEDSKENRVVFNEITKDAVKDSFKHPRGIEMDLVDATSTSYFR